MNRKQVVVGAGSLLSGILASSCCWLPLALVALGAGASTVGAAAGLIDRFRLVFAVAAVGLLAVAYYLVYFRGAKATGRAAGADDCCALQATNQAPDAACSCCGQKGKLVPHETVRALVRESLRASVREGSHVLCPNPACAQVYTSPDGGRLMREDLATRVGYKEQAAPHLVCYCFGHSVEAIEDELRKTGVTTIPDRIREEIRTRRCACDRKNPQGTCCLGNVNRAVKDAQDRLAGRSREPLAAPVVQCAPPPELHEDHGGCWGVPSRAEGTSASRGGRFSRVLLPVMTVAILGMLLFPHWVLSFFAPSNPPSVADAPPGFFKTHLVVPGMTWPQSCPPRVRAALSAVDGVRSVDIDYEPREVTVVGTAAVQPQALVDALARAGFAGSSIRSAAVPRSFVIQVGGMQRGSGGKTWMAWPEAVKGALERLPGVEKVEMDLDRDLFRVTSSANAALKVEDLLGAVRKQGYKPSLADKDVFAATREPLHSTGAVPEVVRAAMERARRESKRFILVDCIGDNWVSCRKMSVRTFADPEVQKLMGEDFVKVELNVDHEKEAAGWFAGNAIPDVWVLSLEGRMLDRIVGFMEPRQFAERLRMTASRH